MAAKKNIAEMEAQLMGDVEEKKPAAEAKLLHAGGTHFCASDVVSFIFGLFFPLLPLGVVFYLVCFTVRSVMTFSSINGESLYANFIKYYASEADDALLWFCIFAIFFVGVFFFVGNIVNLLFVLRTYVNVYENRIEGVSGLPFVPVPCKKFEISREDLVSVNRSGWKLTFTTRAGKKYCVGAKNFESAARVEEFLSRPLTDDDK